MLPSHDQVYHVPMKKYIYVNKYKGRHCSVDGFKRILFMFLYNGSCLRLDVVDVVLAKLRDLHDIVSKLKSYRFFSSSLLIGYDASPQAVSTPLPSPSSMDASSSSADHVDNGVSAFLLHLKCRTSSLKSILTHRLPFHDQENFISPPRFRRAPLSIRSAQRSQSPRNNRCHSHCSSSAKP